MRGLITLLFLVNTFFVVAADDKFIFNVSFTCGYNQRLKYNYNVQFLERDHWNSNDEITPQKIGEARPGLSRFIMEGTQDGDEKTSDGYEVIMHLYHDCTEYEREEEVNIDIQPTCSIGKGVCHYTISKDIKDLSGDSTYIAKLAYQ